MPVQSNNDIETLVRFSHRSLWTLLLVVLVLGAWAFVVAMFPDGQASRMAGGVRIFLPLAIVMAVVALRPVGGKSAPASRAQMKALRNDPLRQLSLNMACRNGFIAVLALQPVLVLLVTAVPPAYPAALMASMTGAAGAAVMLASFLYYDR